MRGSVEPPRLQSLERRLLLAAAAPVHLPMPQSSLVMGPLLAPGVVGGTATTGRQPTGALSGKIVFTVGGHGFTAFDNGGGVGGWHTQRPLTNSMVEDLGNQDQMTFYVNYLWNAGATVVPLRPVGYQPNEVVLDNDDPQVTYSETCTNESDTRF